jgi:ADP-ribose pyrophosphatase YjhB (NUDIX family)
MFKKNAHCSYCGHGYAEDQPWPRTCAHCERISYRNPVPVAVTLLPVDDGLLCVRRDIEPGRGKLALPGGFIDFGETWQAAAARELREETGIVIPAGEIQVFSVDSSDLGDGVLIVFGLARPRTAAALPAFEATDETTERVVITEPTELAFPLHTRAVRAFFARRTGQSS